jgi:hypothetical protein
MDDAFEKYAFNKFNRSLDNGLSQKWQLDESLCNGTPVLTQFDI